MSQFPKVARGTYLIVRTDGTEDLVLEHPRTERIRQLIGADTLDTVILTWAGRMRPDLVMIVDDGGYETRVIDHGGGHIELRPVYAKRPVNQKATEWYWAICKPEFQGHRVVGDVVLARDQDFARR